MYHLPVIDCSTKRVVSHIWHAGVAGRGSDEVSSCLTSYVMKEVPQHVTHLVVSFKDRNKYLFAPFIRCVMTHPTLEVIDHKVERLESESFQNFLEMNILIQQRRKENVHEIHHPKDWADLMKNVKIDNHHPSIKQVTREEFLNFKKLSKQGGPLAIPYKNSDGETFRLSSVRWLRYRKSHPFNVLYKTAFTNDSPFKTINVVVRDDVDLTPSICYQDSRPIPEEKKHYLLHCLPRVNPVYHEFYLNLPVIEEQQIVNEPLIIEAEHHEDLLGQENLDSGVESLDEE